ncbi:MAG: exosortase/archaeosortase family protein [Anaerolineaceae bacterium]
MIPLSTSVYVQSMLLGSSFLVLYSHTLWELGKNCLNNPNFSHGFLVPFMVAFMIWRKRHDLLKLPVRPSQWGLLALGLSLLLHILGNLGAELFTMRFAMIVTIFGLSLYMFGWPITRKTSTPIAYLIFMIPIPAIIWNQMAFPLQLFASKMCAYMVQLAGIPLLREGNVLHLANMRLEVVDACSGLRSLTSLLALSGLLAYVCSLRLFSKWVLFLSAIPIAILTNVLRLFITALLAHLLGATLVEGLAHELGGMLVFIVSLVLLLCTYGILARVERIW